MAVLETIEIETGPEPGATVIVLHGLGADGNDFVPIAQELDLSALGAVRFIFPHAQVIPVTLNGGYRMRAWYDIPARAPAAAAGTDPGVSVAPLEDEVGLRRSMGQVRELLAIEKSRGMPAERTVLAGFSQGCAMALMTGLRHPERLAGIAGLSGYLPLAQTLAAERSDANALTPVFLGHGQQDEMVVMPRGLASRDALRALGYEVQWHDYPMGHSVCMEEIADLNAWLLRTLAPA